MTRLFLGQPFALCRVVCSGVAVVGIVFQLFCCFGFGTGFGSAFWHRGSCFLGRRAWSLFHGCGAGGLFHRCFACFSLSSTHCFCLRTRFWFGRCLPFGLWLGCCFAFRCSRHHSPEKTLNSNLAKPSDPITNIKN